MLLDQELLRFIFGLKLKTARLDKGLSLTVLAQVSGLSPSYLTEIEKGKKYPKTDKIILLAEALDVPYDELISIGLKAELRNITEMLDRNLLKGLPFDVFGIPAPRLFELMAERPQQFSALVGTLLELARAHNIRVDDFFGATLRAFLDMNRNFFPNIEAEAEALEALLVDAVTPEGTVAALSRILTDRYQYSLSFEDFEALNPDLGGVFYFYSKNKRGPQLAIHSGLSAREQAFCLAKELGCTVLGLKKRSVSSVTTHHDSYESLLNNLKASYFASALLIPLASFIAETKAFLAQTSFDANAWAAWARRYPGPPTAFFHRLSQVLPTHFNLGEIFLLRFSYDTATTQFHMGNELHLSQLHGPHRVMSAQDHYCRRWVSSILLQRLAVEPEQGTTAGAQRSLYFDSNNEYLCLSLAYPLPLAPGQYECSTIGIMVNQASQAQVRFLNDVAIPHKSVSDTCEQCPIQDCLERAAPPSRYQQRSSQEAVSRSVQAIIQTRGAEA